jgi:hypothetical protein
VFKKSFFLNVNSVINFRRVIHFLLCLLETQVTTTTTTTTTTNRGGGGVVVVAVVVTVFVRVAVVLVVGAL